MGADGLAAAAAAEEEEAALADGDGDDDARGSVDDCIVVAALERLLDNADDPLLDMVDGMSREETFVLLVPVVGRLSTVIVCVETSPPVIVTTV